MHALCVFVYLQRLPMFLHIPCLWQGQKLRSLQILTDFWCRQIWMGVGLLIIWSLSVPRFTWARQIGISSCMKPFGTLIKMIVGECNAQKSSWYLYVYTRHMHMYVCVHINGCIMYPCMHINGCIMYPCMHIVYICMCVYIYVYRHACWYVYSSGQSMSSSCFCLVTLQSRS